MFYLNGKNTEILIRFNSCTNLYLSSHKFSRFDLKFRWSSLHKFNYATRYKTNIAKAAFENFFDLVDYFYVLWYIYYIDIFGWKSWYWIYFRYISRCQVKEKVEVWIFLCYYMIHENFRFLILKVSFSKKVLHYGSNS